MGGSGPHFFLSYKNSYYSYHHGRTKALCVLRTFVPRVLIPAILESLNFILSSSSLVCNISSFLTKKLICHHFFVWLSSLKKAIVKGTNFHVNHFLIQPFVVDLFMVFCKHWNFKC